MYSVIRQRTEVTGQESCARGQRPHDMLQETKIPQQHTYVHEVFVRPARIKLKQEKNVQKTDKKHMHEEKKNFGLHAIHLETGRQTYQLVV